MNATLTTSTGQTYEISGWSLNMPDGGPIRPSPAPSVVNPTRNVARKNQRANETRRKLAAQKQVPLPLDVQIKRRDERAARLEQLNAPVMRMPKFVPSYYHSDS